MKVQHPDHMDDETFALHMNHRHQDSLGGLDEIWLVNGQVGAAWRKFHHRLHQIRVGLGHWHADYRDD